MLRNHRPEELRDGECAERDPAGRIAFLLAELHGEEKAHRGAAFSATTGGLLPRGLSLKSRHPELCVQAQMPGQRSLVDQFCV